MTASSVQFLSSRRVQLVGMPQGASNRPLPIQESRIELLRDSPVLTPQRVSRNLFGAPKAGEIGELLSKETAQRRSNFLQRYNFDIFCPPTDSCSESKNVSCLEVSQTERLPRLIEKELLDQEKRLSGETSNTCKSAKSKLHLSSNHKSILKQTEQVHKQNGSSAISDSTTIGVTSEACLSATKAIPADSSERLKPYSRQTLITDCYSLRKTNIGKNNRTAIAIVAASHQQKINVVPLPQSIRAKCESLSSSATSSDSKNEESTSQSLELPYK